MLQKNIDGIFQLTFSVEADDFGSTRVVDLSPGGREIPATSKTKAMFNYLSKID
jgi:E3 ubiquitin-protein ligase HUWE1